MAAATARPANCARKAGRSSRRKPHDLCRQRNLLTLQGEGAQTGRAAVFLRFAGCNLWTGLEHDRDEAVCKFCDTDFVGVNGRAAASSRPPTLWPTRWQPAWPQKCGGKPYVVCTGGEPLLQLDTPLIDAFHARGFEIGHRDQRHHRGAGGHRLDLRQAQGRRAPSCRPAATSSSWSIRRRKPRRIHHAFEQLSFEHFYLQPLDVIGDPAQTAAHVASAAAYCLAHPLWRLSTQTHKLTGFALREPFVYRNSGRQNRYTVLLELL